MRILCQTASKVPMLQQYGTTPQYYNALPTGAPATHSSLRILLLSPGTAVVDYFYYNTTVRLLKQARDYDMHSKA
eukprot:5489360-Pyramimonas_sp.AAC.1